MRIATIIPSYNAEKTLSMVIDTLPNQCKTNENRVIIVNDSSSDTTAEIAENLAEQHNFVTTLHHQKNRGYGGALKTGLRYGLENNFQIMPVVHSDGQYAPEMVIELSQPILNNQAKIVQGSRFAKTTTKNSRSARKGGMPWSRFIANRLLTTIENATFGTHLAEFHSGYMIYSAKLLNSVPFEALQENYNFDAEMIILASLIGEETTEIPIPTKYDDETSSLNPIPYGLNVLRMIWRYKISHYHQLLQRHQS